MAVAVLPAVGYLVLLFVFTRFELSRIVPTLAATAVVLSIVLGVLILKEQVNVWNVAGVILAVGAIVLAQIR
jgi:drug/metabolite transporter (DMT)-like permease